MKKVLLQTIWLSLPIVFMSCSLWPLNLAYGAPERQDESIRLQLKWLHQFQFAGFYAAIEQGYYQADPVQIYALKTCAPFVWSYQRPEKTALRVVLAEQHQPVQNYMRDHRMSCGATVPLHLPNGGFGTITGITSCSQQELALNETLAELSFIAHAFHESVFPLFDKDTLTCQHVHLSKRERECLAWSAEGLTAKEIARKLHRSVATVSLHLNTATHKLGASNRVQAVVRAMHYRLLDS